MKSLEHYWYESSVLAILVVCLLLPLSGLYCLVISVRRKLYQLNIKKSFAAQVPVVVVGNIVAGGSGKTPLLISLCDYVSKKGFKPGVVSRGYGGSLTGLKQVASDDMAEQVGDEPLMISQRTNVPVVVGADRVSAINYLLTKNQCDIVFSDDGLQHYRMRRDFEIAVIDAVRKFGNGFCLPAGPLRERVSRLKEVDLVVYNGSNIKSTDEYSYKLQITGLKQLNGEMDRPLSSFVKNMTVHAVAGIGHPARFFNQLTESGVSIIEHAFPDHHNYQQDDFSAWQSDCIIMTEKDAVKCRHLALPDAWVVVVNAELSATLEAQLDAKLLPLLNQSVRIL
jgi:tetraacyldisaccharide 4'-kinase